MNGFASLPCAPPVHGPRLAGYGTFRKVTRQGFSGNADSGLCLGPDGTTMLAADDAVIGGSR